MSAAFHPTDIHVGLRIRMRRREAGMTQEGLAELLGITFQQVQKYERGANRVSASRLQAIANALGEPIAYFFEGLPGQPVAQSAALSEDFLALPDAQAFVDLLPKMPFRVRQRLLDLARSLHS